MTCSVPTCARTADQRIPRDGQRQQKDAKGRFAAVDGDPVCIAHYQRWWSTGDVQADVPLPPRRPPVRCKVCGKRTKRRRNKFCSRACHYVWMRRQVPASALREAHGFVWVFVGDTWKPRAVVIWEQVHGRQVPAGCVVTHRDGDRVNDSPTNLTLARRRQVA